MLHLVVIWHQWLCTEIIKQPYRVAFLNDEQPHACVYVCMCVCMCMYFANNFFASFTGECLEYYPTKSDGFRHYSNHNNKFACEINKGIWVQFSNYLEEYPQQQTEAGCKSAITRKFRLIWAIPYRSEDIDKLKMVNNNVESLKRCLVALNAPECKVAPRTRTNHLGNADGVVPLRYNWKLPYYPSGHAQRCVFRIR